MKKTTEKNRIVAEGEVTGHAHRVGEEAEVEVIEGTNRRIVAERATRITHEEHKPLDIPAGRHLTGIVREVDPFADEIREVRD